MKIKLMKNPKYKGFVFVTPFKFNSIKVLQKYYVEIGNFFKSLMVTKNYNKFIH